MQAIITKIAEIWIKFLTRSVDEIFIQQTIPVLTHIEFLPMCQQLAFIRMIQRAYVPPFASLPARFTIPCHGFYRPEDLDYVYIALIRDYARKIPFFNDKGMIDHIMDNSDTEETRGLFAPAEDFYSISELENLLQRLEKFKEGGYVVLH